MNSEEIFACIKEKLQTEDEFTLFMKECPPDLEFIPTYSGCPLAYFLQDSCKEPLIRVGYKRYWIYGYGASPEEQKLPEWCHTFTGMFDEYYSTTRGSRSLVSSNVLDIIKTMMREKTA